MLTKFASTNEGEVVMQTFYFVILSATLATIVGAFGIPTFQRILTRAVIQFSEERSMSKLLLHGFSKTGIKHILMSVKVPDKGNVSRFDFRAIPMKILIANVVIESIQMVGFLSPIFASTLSRELGSTCVTLSSAINWIATLLLYLYVYPFLSVKTDDVVEGKCSQAEFRQCVIGMVGTKVIGIGISVFLLVPAGYFIVFIAKILP